MGILEELWERASKKAQTLRIEKPEPSSLKLLGPPSDSDVANFKQLTRPRQIAVAKQYGHFYKKCIYCGRWLNDPRSQKNGYGKRCAEINALPWE